MKTLKQEYSLNQTRFSGFKKAYSDFGIPAVSDSYMVSSQFINLMYASIKNAKSDKYTFLSGPNESYSIYAGRTLLAKIRGGKLVHIWLPGLVKQNKDTEFLQSMGTEYLVFAGFPDLVHGGGNFMKYAYELKQLCVPNMKDSGQGTLFHSQIERLYMPKITKLGKDSLYDNELCVAFNAPNVRELGDNVLFSNMVLNSENDKVYAPNLTRVGRCCADVFYTLRDENLSR